MGTNFITGRVEKGGFIFNGNRVDLPVKFQDIRVYGSRENLVMLGIKPEEILISKIRLKNYMKAKIELIQPFPPRVNIVCSIRGIELNVVDRMKNIKGV